MVCFTTSVIKILLGVFNFIFLLLGGGITYMGVSLIKWQNEYTHAIDLTNVDIKSTSFVILAVGIVIMLISFFGFFGACCENALMLNTYGFLMVLLIAGQVFTLVYAIKYKNNMTDEVEGGIKKAMSNMNQNAETRKTIDKLQCSFKCCGWDNATDFGDQTLPSSCCGHCDKEEACKPQDALKDGCKTKVQFDKINAFFGSIIGLSVAIILFDTILVFAACCLAREVRYL